MRRGASGWSVARTEMSCDDTYNLQYVSRETISSNLLLHAEARKLQIQGSSEAN